MHAFTGSAPRGAGVDRCAGCWGGPGPAGRSHLGRWPGADDERRGDARRGGGRARRAHRGRRQPRRGDEAAGPGHDAHRAGRPHAAAGLRRCARPRHDGRLPGAVGQPAGAARWRGARHRLAAEDAARLDRRQRRRGTAGQAGGRLRLRQLAAEGAAPPHTRRAGCGVEGRGHRRRAPVRPPGGAELQGAGTGGLQRTDARPAGRRDPAPPRQPGAERRAGRKRAEPGPAQAAGRHRRRRFSGLCQGRQRAVGALRLHHRAGGPRHAAGGGGAARRGRQGRSEDRRGRLPRRAGRPRLHQGPGQPRLPQPPARGRRQAHHRRLAAGLHRLARPAVLQAGGQLPAGLRGLCQRHECAGDRRGGLGLCQP